MSNKGLRPTPLRASMEQTGEKEASRQMFETARTLPNGNLVIPGPTADFMRKALRGVRNVLRGLHGMHEQENRPQIVKIAKALEVLKQRRVHDLVLSGETAHFLRESCHELKVQVATQHDRTDLSEAVYLTCLLQRAIEHSPEVETETRTGTAEGKPSRNEPATSP